MSTLHHEEILESLFERVCEEVAEKYPYLSDYEVESMATTITEDRFEFLCQ
tara:strand:+ start:44 stop:196 length:153 start_codon:yes stop_codon:yes gene_type:complete